MSMLSLPPCGKQTSPNLLCHVTLGGVLTAIRIYTLFVNQECATCTLLAHWANICQIARALLPPGDQTRRTMESPGVLKNCEDLLRIFDPIACALNKMQRNTTTLGEAVEIWIELLGNIPKRYDQTVRQENRQGILVCLAIGSNGRSKLIRYDDRQDCASY